MTMVEFGEMRDKQSQQRRRRADGAIRSVADRSAVEENRALAPQAAQTTQRWSSVDRESSCAGRDSLDSAERGSLAGPAGEIPASFEVLAATARLGGAGRLVEYLANVFERVKRDGRGLPLGNYLHSASPAEVKLAETTLATIRVGRSHHSGRPRQKPMRVIADKAYDSDPLRERLRQRGIELICPHKRNRVRPATQDGRVLRRYQRRWIVERTHAWLGNFRRLVVRYDRSLMIYGAFFHIACFMIVLRRVVQ